MASDIFLKFTPPLKGESLDATHPGEIELMSWSWGVSNPTSFTGSGGMSAGKASFGEVSFTHNMDKSSPTLMQQCALGKHFTDATVSQRKAAGDGQKDFLIFKFTEVYITSLQTSGGGGADVMESVSMAYGKVELEYKPQKPDGTLDASVKFGYDLKKMVGS